MIAAHGLNKTTQLVVAKIGTSSVTDDGGAIDTAAIAKFCREVASLREAGHKVVIVTSGAIAAGLPELGLGGDRRPSDARTLQAVATIGQGALMEVYRRELRRHGLIAGQVLLVPLDFVLRSQYLHARRTIERLLELGVVAVVNENDAIADEEIRFGDNDRLAALVANLIDADRLIILTDIQGVLTADPRIDATATLIEEIVEFDQQLATVAGGAGTTRGSGGMSSKLTAARIASWSGVCTVIASANRDQVLADAVNEMPGVGTIVRPRASRLPARKLWIAFAGASRGQVTVDAGARGALERGASLLAVGVRGVDGKFGAGEPVELADQEGVVFAKGLSRLDAADIRVVAGQPRASRADGDPLIVVHADDLVTIPALLT